MSQVPFSLTLIAISKALQSIKNYVDAHYKERYLLVLEIETTQTDLCSCEMRGLKFLI